MFKTLQEDPTLAQRQSKESQKNRNTSQNCPAIIERCAWFQKAAVGIPHNGRAFINRNTKCITLRGRIIFNHFPQRWQPYPQQVRLSSIREGDAHSKRWKSLCYFAMIGSRRLVFSRQYSQLVDTSIRIFNVRNRTIIVSLPCGCRPDSKIVQILQQKWNCWETGPRPWCCRTG